MLVLEDALAILAASVDETTAGLAEVLLELRRCSSSR
jgi:hypothetical protein